MRKNLKVGDRVRVKHSGGVMTRDFAGKEGTVEIVTGNYVHVRLQDQRDNGNRTSYKTYAFTHDEVYKCV